MRKLRPVDQEIASRLRKARGDAFDTASEAARAFGVPVPTYVSHENGNRGIDLPTLRAYAARLRVSIDWLAFGKGTEREPASKPNSRGIPHGNSNVKVDKEIATTPKTFVVVGTAEAGKFFPMDEIQTDPDLPATVSGDLSERFPAVSHLAFRVKGDSMDGAGIQHGDFVIAVDWIEAGLSMETESGSIVVVERTLFGGQAIELTIKYLEVRPDVYLLHPRSSNPKHKSITVPRDEADDGTEVRIRALVVGVTRSLERKRWTPPEV